MEAEGGPGCLVAQVGEITYLIARKSINEQGSTHGGGYWEERSEQAWGQEVGPCTGLVIGGLPWKNYTDFVLTRGIWLYSIFIVFAFSVRQALLQMVAAQRHYSQGCVCLHPVLGSWVQLGLTGLLQTGISCM